MSRLFDILHLKFPAPQINSQKCSLEETAGEQKTGLPAWSGWANRSFVVSETPIGGVRDALRRRRRGDNVPPSRGPGAQPRHAFGSFRRETKGTPGVGRVGPPMGAEAKSDDLLWGPKAPTWGVQRGAPEVLPPRRETGYPHPPLGERKRGSAEGAPEVLPPRKTSLGTCKKPPPMVS